MTFELPDKVRSNIAYTYYNTIKDPICDDLMELFGFTLRDEYIYFKDRKFNPKGLSCEVTPYIFSTEETEAIEEILNKEYNYAFNASPLLDCMGWIIRREFDCYKIRYALSSIYELDSEPMVPWDYDLEEGDIDWMHGDDWEDGFDLDKDLPKHWLTNDSKTNEDTPLMELGTPSEEDIVEY